MPLASAAPENPTRPNPVADGSVGVPGPGFRIINTDPKDNPMKFSRIVPALIAAGLIALTGCSSPATTAPTSGTSGAPAGNTGLADLQKAGVLKIATEGTYAPFTYHDPQTNELVGYDVEVITAVAEKLGVKAEFSETKWDSIFAGLDAKRYDLIANQVTPNAEREARYDITDPYTVTFPVVFVKADNTSITSLADLKGKRAAQSVSNWAEIAKSAGAEIAPVDGFTESVAAVRDNRVDLSVNDQLALLEYFTTTKDTSIKIAVELTDQKLVQAFALRKNSGLVEPINTALAELSADGTLAKLGEKYFGQDVSK